MKHLFRIGFIITVHIILSAYLWNPAHAQDTEIIAQDIANIDTVINLPYPFEDDGAFDYPGQQNSSPLYLRRPENVEQYVEYDIETGQYVIYEKIGDITYRLPKALSLREYLQYDMENSIRSYWHQRVDAEDFETHSEGFIPKLQFGGEAFNKLFGGNSVSINPQGYVDISFGYKSSFRDNNDIPIRNRRVSTFDFDQKIRLNVTGKIGDKLDMRVNYDTESTFDFENKMNINYVGEEDEIIKKIEAGNVSLPLNGSLITGGTNLFGIKTEMQFGKLTLTTVLSQHKGETKVIETEGGAQKSTFEIEAVDYDANRHFFLSKFFRDRYNQALQNLPIINSQVQINKVEVWVTNKKGDFEEARDIVAFVDLGEPENYISNGVPQFGPDNLLGYPDNMYPHNKGNLMYEELKNNYPDIRTISQVIKTFNPLNGVFNLGIDYEKLEQARKLSPSEFSFNEKLGYVSISSSLNAAEILAVAYSYSIGGTTYQVGEFSTDGIESPQALMVKLLKGTALSPQYPTWDLMMKNVYDLNAYEMDKQDFILDVLYLDDNKGTFINYLPETQLEGHILLKVMNLDNVNTQGDIPGDGVFDFFDGYTVLANKGKVIFPVLEPFGQHLADSIGDPVMAEKYAFTVLYDSTITVARQDAEHNKFRLKGSYKGSSTNEIRLNAINLSPGSVRISSGGMELTENQDYTVDYNLGTVRIINPSYQSGASLQISTESQELFSMQTKTLIGTHANYTISDDFNIGATAMWMNEKSYTYKVNFGQEPISNLILGVDASYRGKSQFLTNLVDKLPFIDTKETSSIALELEAAKLIPGSSKSIKGASYIDDFDNTSTSINLKNRSSWVLSSVPQQQSILFREGDLIDDIASGFNRAKLAWYDIETIFTGSDTRTPGHIKGDLAQLSNHYVREIYQKEIFPHKDIASGVPTRIPALNLAFYPDEKGPYNYETEPSEYSSGVNPDGTLRDPESRWGGIMREIATSDFELANVEFIEFWLLDPFIYDETDSHNGGDLYFNLGNISEDILRDSRKAFEQGLPTSADLQLNIDSTSWGVVSTHTALGNGFDDQTRDQQDIGLDGLTSENEQSFFEGYLNNLGNILSPEAYQQAASDPSNDDYHYFLGTDYDNNQVGILDRYKKFNNHEGNSSTNANNSSIWPDQEDINRDNTMNELESYFQYRISIRKNDLEVGQNYIADKITSPVLLRNGETEEVTWYQFKIPVNEFEDKFGPISDFKSIRFMRMIMKGFDRETILRFASLDLVRADWRRYEKDLGEDDVVSPDASIEVSSVSIEENGNREPVNYILPQDITRLQDPQNPQLTQLNERSLALKIKELMPGDARAVYKTTAYDMRRYRQLKMDVHAEEISGYPLNDNQLHVFLRLGADFSNNYYEYEIPLKLTAPGFYNDDVETDRLKVWPETNRFDFPLEVLTQLKQQRNAEMRQAGSTIRIVDEYEGVHNENIIRIKGNPNLGNVSVMMIGVRHPKTNLNLGARSVEVWTNEFRLTNFDQKGGWAAQGRVTARLADLGSVTMAGRVRTAGFGSVEQRMNERANDDLYEYDITSNIELGRFFPKESGVRIPVYMAYSKSLRNPEYNPIDPDIKLKDALSNATPGERDSIKHIAQDYMTRKSININNVTIDKRSQGKNPKVYDLSNFSATYAYNEIYKRNVNTEYNIDKTHRALFTYNFNNRPQPVTPFKKVNALKGKAFRLIKDFNFYTSPTQISFRTDLYRRYNEVQMRNLSNPNLIIPRTFNKDFIWNRYFDLRYDLSRSLRFDISTQGTARIDEPFGRIHRDDDDFKVKRDSILRNLFKGGRPTLYHHTFNANYRLPIDKLPLLDWVTSSIRYRGDYDWETSPVIDDPEINLGNTIQNSRNVQWSGQLNLNSLYNKIKFLEKINKSIAKSSSSKYYSGNRGKGQPTKKDAAEKQEETRDVKYKTRRSELKRGQAIQIAHNLGVPNAQLTVVDSNGNKLMGEKQIVNENTLTFTPRANIEKATFEVTGKAPVRNPFMRKLARTGARLLLSIRNISFTYAQGEGTLVPGFLPSPKFFGSSNYTPDEDLFGRVVGSSYAPGLPFVLGWQDKNFAQKATEQGWLTPDTMRADYYKMTYNENLNIRSMIEPLNNLRINVVANRTYSRNSSERYRFNKTTNTFDVLDKTVQGSFSMTVNTIGTAFSKIGEDEPYISKAYDNFLANREIIATRLNAQRIANPAEKGYDLDGKYNPAFNNPETQFPDGYGPTSQQVLIPAFLAAYTGKDANDISLSPFPSVSSIRPNWRISYEGRVAQIEGLNKYLKSLNFSHSYSSTYNMGGYISNFNYNNTEYGDGFSYVKDQAENFVPDRDINSVSITEQLSPLINVDAIWINDLTTRIEIRRSRMLMLSFANNSLTEQLDNEFVVGLGYRFKDIKLFVKSRNSEKSFSNDLNVNANLSFKKSQKVLRKIAEGTSKSMPGSKTMNFEMYAEYQLDNRFQMRAFYNYNSNDPIGQVGGSYFQSNSEFGLSFKFMLAQ